ncbi:MAG: MiaB/RimO family radical SAM methylthiotransferase, partial [Anaerolineae bacterium]
MRVYLESLGCRLNAAEIENLAREFAGAGLEVVDAPDQADLIVLNSCAVTVQAARRSRHRLRALHRERPSADLAVTGCWATEDVERARRVGGVRWVVPNPDKARTVAKIVGHDSERAPWAPGRWGHTRAFLGVQDGCDHACTYCVTRLLRGPARSRPLAETVAEVQALVAQGAQEVVLTGVSLGSYGHDQAPSVTLADLVDAILTDTDLPRLRLSSIEPWDVDERLLSLWTHPRLCRQLHLPLQSGSDAVLKRMGRRITTDAFEQLVRRAREVAPGIAITTDLIAGFPGETEGDFARTLDYVEAIGFARLHVFRYSERA